MHSPYSSESNCSSNSSSYTLGESGSPHQGAVPPLDKQDSSSQLSPVSPQQQQQQSLFPDTGSSRLKRRASQGSLLTKPSPVSRFLSRSNASLHLPSFDHIGLSQKSKSSSRLESRTHSADSRLRLHTTSAASSSLATRASQYTKVWDFEAKGDYPTALPPTPPEDDEYVAWNPRSGMLLFESPLNREPGPMAMDEGPNVDSAARGAATDGLSSPSDQLSNVSPSSSGSPGSSGDMDCDLNSWLENGIEATGPILDPLLRQLVVVNELSADVGRYLGKLSSVSHMEDFDTMRNKLAQLCSDLSSSSSQFTIADARKGSAHLDRQVWTEWFIHQERTRMKETLSLYWQNGRRLPAAKAASNMSANYLLEDKEVTSAMLLGEILDGIRKRPYGEETEPRDGIELGVFVIRRSH
ncbi:hypothetical protein BBP40_005673 [Aspergillus hancockii]|nr:hypothetical protein BBP40_005673 [Aspergillus hancockii]